MSGDGLSMILAARPENTGSDCLSDSDIEKENLGFIISYFYELTHSSILFLAKLQKVLNEF